MVADPHHMPRWWPEVRRMEAVEDERFTQVFTTRRGHVVRMDFRLVDSRAPGPGGDPPGRRVWEQELAGTPFERVLSQALTEVVLEPADGGTLVTLTQTQRLRGYSRTGGLFLRRATRARLERALAGLEALLGGA